MALQRFRQPLGHDIWASGRERALAFRDILFHLRSDTPGSGVCVLIDDPLSTIGYGCEFSLGLLPHIKILLSSPGLHGPVRTGRVQARGGWRLQPLRGPDPRGGRAGRKAPLAGRTQRDKGGLAPERGGEGRAGTGPVCLSVGAVLAWGLQKSRPCKTGSPDRP